MKPLRICVEFFDFLNSDGIRYCHWKSNEHLADALSGTTDLDILVAVADKDRFEDALTAYQFKSIVSPPWKTFPGIEDWLGFDHASGQLVHLHLHYMLVLGEKHIKNHHLPLEPFILSHLRTLHGVSVPVPEVELLLLTIRSSLKLSTFSLLAFCIGAARWPYPAGVIREFEFLLQDYDTDLFKSTLRESQLPLNESCIVIFLNEMKEKRLRPSTVISIRFRIFRRLRQYRRHGLLRSRLLYSAEQLRNLMIVMRLIRPRKKRMSGRGRMFALVGADGSGKSGLLKSLQEWMGWKVETRGFYLGAPKDLFSKVFCRITFGPAGRRGRVRSALVSLWWVTVAARRYRIWSRAQVWAGRGGISITDRFPLTEFRDMVEPMDGPRIAGTNGRLTELERWYYARIGRPDLIFVLKGSIEELQRRRPGQDIGEHERKIEAVNGLADGCDMESVDCNRPCAEVLLDVKRRIWRHLIEEGTPHDS